MGSALLVNENRRIEISGGIASGKTTLAQLLGRVGVPSILENFQANPFWEAFYADPVGAAFETEISFLLQHYHDIKTSIKQENAFSCDFSLLLDFAYAQVTLDNRKRAAFTAVFREILSELSAPGLVIHLICDPQVELDRIRQRGREVEQSIGVDYLDAVNQALDRVLLEEGTAWNILTIDSAALDFANDEADQNSVLEAVRFRLGQIANR